MKIDIKGLTLVLEELDGLDRRDQEGTITKAEQRRRVSLMAQASAIKETGVKLKDIQRQQVNESAREAGLPEFDFGGKSKTKKKELRAQAWKQFVNLAHTEERMELLEQRDENQGNPATRIGTYSALGYFVPTGFWPKVYNAMAWHDVLFDEEHTNVLHDTNGRPLPVPVYGDIENQAIQIGESAQSQELDIASPSQVVLGAFSYRSDIVRVSMEAFDDVNQTIGTVKLLTKMLADRMARGIGKQLVLGGISTRSGGNTPGSGSPTGLLPSLLTAGCPVVISAGSGANDGVGVAATSLGSQDFANAIKQLDAAYLASDKIRWLMNNKTLASLLALIDKQGRPLGLVQGKPDNYSIYGIRVGVCPSLPNMAASTNSCALVDLNYWMTRLVQDDNTGILLDHERYIDFGQIGFQLFMRADGALLYSDTGSPCPGVVIQQHS